MEITGIFSESFWYWAPMLVAATVAIAGLINGAFGITSGIWPQVISWIVGSILAIASFLIGLIEFGEPTLVSVGALCCVIGLSSNGVYDIPTIKDWVDSWFNNAPTIEE